MKNQINIDDQNAQQIGQNPRNQSTQISERPKMRYVIIRIAVLVGLTLFGFGAYYLGKQSSKNTVEQNQNQTFPSIIITENDVTAGWKTYNSMDNSIMFKYPEDWQAEKEEIFGSRSVTEFKYNNTPLFELTVQGNYNQVTEQSYKNLKEFLGARLSKSKETLVDGQEAKRIEDQGDPGHVIPYEEVLVFTPDKKAIVSLYYKSSYYDKPNANRILDQILSTFKFLNQKTSVTLPDKFGFTKLIELKAIGIKAKFPQNVSVSLSEKNFYVIKAGGADEVTFILKDYDGKGRRAWFQKNYPFATDYVFEPFTAAGHSGYIAYAKLPKDLPGGFYYFTAINSNTMLVVTGSDYVDRLSIFYGNDLQRVKSFLSTIEFIASQNTRLEDYPPMSQLYRWSDKRKTVWEDTDLGLKITAPEWTETRYARERDANGKFIYTDWVRTYPEGKTYDNNPSSEYIKGVVVTGGYIYSKSLSVLSSRYQGKTFLEVVNERLIPAGFCTTEWKSSKAECTGSDFCYTRDEVVQNLIVKKQVKIGTLDAQLRSMNQVFSNKNDCRSEDTWMIKAKNGQFILSNTSESDNEIIKVEAL